MRPEDVATLESLDNMIKAGRYKRAAELAYRLVATGMKIADALRESNEMLESIVRTADTIANSQESIITSQEEIMTRHGIEIPRYTHPTVN